MVSTTIEALPIHLLHLIGRELAPDPIELEPWSDGATCAAAAASCVIASRTTEHIGMEAYRALLGDARPDFSVLPDGVSEKSTVKQLRAALAKWRLVKSGNKADLWSRLKQHHSPHCPVPSFMRNDIRTRAPTEDYLLRDDVSSCSVSRIVDLHAKSMQLHGSIAGWMTAFKDREKERVFYAVHCQPFYDQEVDRYVADWEDREEEYWRCNGGRYWRSRERYRNGYEDSDEELEEVTETAREAAKPKALERWVEASAGNLRGVASCAFISSSLRKRFLTKLVEKTIDDWVTCLTPTPILFLSVQQTKKEIRESFFPKTRVDDLDDLDKTFSAERFDALRKEVSAMSDRLKEACERVSTAYDEIPRGEPHPSLKELFPSTAKLLDIDGRLLAGDPDALLPLFNRMVQKKKEDLERQNAARKLTEESRRRLMQDLDTVSVGQRIRCAMCLGNSRTFEKNALRDHARAKHNLPI